ncbi:hypothetical protein COOONC_06149 [Cooperia oncophora]
MALMRRKAGNGIKKGSVSQVNVAAKDAPAVQDKTRHVVSYSYSKNQTVLVEYVADPFKDMFQIGRSSEEQIDFTIVDTWLASGSQIASSSGMIEFDRFSILCGITGFNGVLRATESFR